MTSGEDVVDHRNPGENIEPSALLDGVQIGDVTIQKLWMQLGCHLDALGCVGDTPSDATRGPLNKGRQSPGRPEAESNDWLQTWQGLGADLANDDV